MLLERDSEIAVLEALLESGGLVVVEGGAGIGKTSLLGEFSERAGRRGWRVLQGCGSELETGFAFGLARQLFERDLASASKQERAELTAGPAAAAGELLGGQVGARGAEDVSFGIVHGLYWLVVNMAARQPVLLTVDDAHWADEASARWLAYLARRLEGLEVAVVIALRPAAAGEPRGRPADSQVDGASCPPGAAQCGCRGGTGAGGGGWRHHRRPMRCALGG